MGKLAAGGMSDEEAIDSNEEYDDELDNQFELGVIVDQVKTPLIKKDEFSYFSQGLNQMA